MKKYLRFFSFAVMTQLILLLNQVVLLPMQLRLWGNSETALWYAAIALATGTTVADLGLRTAGHVELLRLVRTGDPGATAKFRQVWTLIRLLVMVVTALLLVGELVVGSKNWALGRALLTLAYAVETLLIIRIVYLDSLGEYSGAEASYFTFAAVRFALAIPALLVFRLQPTGLCWLFFATSVVGLMLQGLLCRIPRELAIFSRPPRRLSFKTCSLVRYTMSEPCANWVRISLPVLVIAAIAPATAVTTYVALRAIYGAARTTIQQMARVASVEVLNLRAADQRETADSLLAGFLLFTAVIGTALASFVVLDNMRLLSLWLKHFDGVLFQNINLCFALASPFFSYQVMVALSFRTGRLAGMARRQYAYMMYSAGCAGAAWLTRSLAVYLGLLVATEIALSLSFMLRPNLAGDADSSNAGWGGVAASSAGAILILALWMTVHSSTTNWFARISPAHVMQTALLWAVAPATLLLIGLVMNAGMLRSLRAALRRPAGTVNA
jgi:hypothetical protein